MIVAEYLRLAVGEDYLVVDCHRFPLGQRLHQQLLLDLREATKVSADSRKQPLAEEHMAAVRKVTLSKSESVARTSGGPTSKPSSRPEDLIW